MTWKDSLRPWVPGWLLNSYHWTMGFLAALRYGFPTRGLTVVGITGTNGKTTTAFLTEAVLRAGGQRVGLMTTVAVGALGRHEPNRIKMTTADPFTLNRWLAELRAAGCRTIVMEVTSHALAQHRVFGIRFDTVLFTNLTHDHLDYHQTKEAYRDTKLQLFANHPRVAIANLDDPEGGRFLSLPAGRRYGFRLSSRSANGRREIPSEQRDFSQAARNDQSKGTILKGKILKATATGTRIRVTTPASELELTVPLPGGFNVSNALGAIAVGFGFDLPIAKIVTGVESVRDLPGRMESIDKGQPFQVIVDYAHTPDALKRVFDTLKPTVRGRLIHVAGATGDRDTMKRPILGALAGQYADIVIVTDEDPGSEDPLAIMQAVAEGVRQSRSHRIRGHAAGNTPGVAERLSRSGGSRVKEDEDFFLIPDRREAITKALDLAKKDDLVLITGKGHEEIMAVKGAFVPFSDRKIVAELLEHRA